MSRTTTLVTGFGPFLSVKDNPSGRLAQQSQRSHVVLDVAFRAVDEFLEQVDPNSFDRLLMMGVAAKRHFVTPELFARNRYQSVPDVTGEVRSDEIELGAPLLLTSTLWRPERISWAYLGQPLRTSCDAGGYMCNYIAYRALRRFSDKEVGFLHIPAFEEVSEEEQLRALLEILEAVETGR